MPGNPSQMAGTQSQMAQAQSQIQSQKSSQSQESKVKVKVKSNPFGRAGIKCEMESNQKSNPGSKSQIKLISPPSVEVLFLKEHFNKNISHPWGVFVDRTWIRTALGFSLTKRPQTRKA